MEHTYLAAALPVWELAAMSVRTLEDAANRYRSARGMPVRPVRLDGARIAASFSGDRLLRIAGQPVEGFAELSGFFAAADGFVRTHANYPHHRGRLLAALELPQDTDRATFARRIATLPAADAEQRAHLADAIAVRVRDETEWATSEPGIAAASGPLVAVRTRDPQDSGAAEASRPDPSSAGGSSATDPAPERPLAGIRVLDLTRVIAGPTATRTLALLGADVLRIDPPHIPEIPWQHTELGQGKRTAQLDMRSDFARAQALADEADVLVTGYRPGAVERFGLRLRADTVHGRISAWGRTGPWAQRRGFDSIVQAASGISLIEGSPGALPAQALDHASGYLLAAGIVDALGAGGGRDVDVALARTAAWLLGAPGRNADHPTSSLPTDGVLVAHGDVRYARPALAGYDDYPFPAHPWGSDAPSFA